MTARKRVLITGATGNIGTALLRRFGREPDWDVIGVARRLPTAQAPYERATWHAVDVTDPVATAELTRVMSGVDAVVHLVWAFQPTRDAHYLTDVGVGGTRRVLEAVRRAGVPHLVHMSSVGAYAARRDLAPVPETYPHDGMATSQYSRDKAAAEALLDAAEVEHPDSPTITRIRPGIVLQRAAGAALARYGLPAYLPTRLLPLLPVLPLDRDFVVPVVHADDVADGVFRAVDRNAGGAFNLATDAPLTRADVAAAFGARPVHVPAPVLRAAVAASWRLRLQPLSPGWIDLAFAAPLMSTARAHTELGWQARVTARQAITEAVAGIADNAATASPALRPRAVADRVRRLAASGPVSVRKQS